MLTRHTHLFVCFVLIAGCSDAVTWTNVEIENGKRIFIAIEAANKAGLLLRQYETEPDQQILRTDLIAQLQRAHVQAIQVDDIVLDKMHPSMHLHFRKRFQLALAKLIRYYNGDVSVDVDSAVKDMADFQQWFKTHQQELRLW